MALPAVRGRKPALAGTGAGWGAPCPCPLSPPPRWGWAHGSLTASREKPPELPWADSPRLGPGSHPAEGPAPRPGYVTPRGTAHPGLTRTRCPAPAEEMWPQTRPQHLSPWVNAQEPARLQPQGIKAAVCGSCGRKKPAKLQQTNQLPSFHTPFHFHKQFRWLYYLHSYTA